MDATSALEWLAMHETTFMVEVALVEDGTTFEEAEAFRHSELLAASTEPALAESEGLQFGL